MADQPPPDSSWVSPSSSSPSGAACDSTLGRKRCPCRRDAQRSRRATKEEGRGAHAEREVDERLKVGGRKKIRREESCHFNVARICSSSSIMHNLALHLSHVLLELLGPPPVLLAPRRTLPLAVLSAPRAVFRFANFLPHHLNVASIRLACLRRKDVDDKRPGVEEGPAGSGVARRGRIAAGPTVAEGPGPSVLCRRGRKPVNVGPGGGRSKR